MWGDAFEVVPDETAGSYWMGFYGANPNFAASEANGKTFNRNAAGQPECELQYFHHPYAQEQKIGDYSACHPYSESSCCKNTTLENFDSLGPLYGEEYHVERCGPISESCKAYFMAEACFYECDPNAGLYRRYSDEEVAADIAANGEETNTNTWEMYKMPMKASFCNDWYAACYDDYFCSVDNGNFFSCAEVYVAPQTATEIKYEDEKDWNTSLTIIVVVVGFVCVAVCAALFYIVHQEKSGHPVFTPLVDQEGPGSTEDTEVRKVAVTTYTDEGV